MTSVKSIQADIPFNNREEKWELMLFVAGDNAATRIVYSRLEQMCEEKLSGRYRIKLVDIFENLEQACAFDIVATPTLLRLNPKPVRRILGDLSKTEKVLTALGLYNGESSN